MMDARVPIRKLDVKNFVETTSSDHFSFSKDAKYGDNCDLHRNQGKSDCEIVTFINVADAVTAMQHGERERLHNRDLTVEAFWLQPHKYLQNDTESISIHMLNDDCLRYIFQFLPIADGLRIDTVCKRWRDLSHDSWHMIKTLDLSHSTWGFSYLPHFIDTALLLKILIKCGRFLTQINLSNRDCELCPGTLSIIGKLCPNLTSIEVIGLKICASDIRTLANNCRNITKFELGTSHIGYINWDNELNYFFELNQNLEYLAIKNSMLFSESLLCLPEQTMHTIILKCSPVREKFFLTALKRLKNLKHLTIIECHGITERTLEVVGQHCKNLRALELGCIDPMDVSYLIHLVDLQILRISYNPKVSDDFLADLVKHCQQLTNLNISSCEGVSDAGLAAVARLVRLEKLNVNNMSQITDDGLKNMCGLKELECQYGQFTDRGMSRFINSSPQLQLLDLHGCENITDTTLEVAKHACSNRTNNVMLKMMVDETAILTRDRTNLPPLLHIVTERDLYPILAELPEYDTAWWWYQPWTPRVVKLPR